MSHQNIPEYYVKHIAGDYYIILVEEDGTLVESIKKDYSQLKEWLKGYTYENFRKHYAKCDEKSLKAIRPLKITWIFKMIFPTVSINSNKRKI